MIFHESTTHAVVPWRGGSPRRSLLFKFCPGFMSFHGQNGELTLPEWADELTPGQAALLEGPWRPSTLGGGLRERAVQARERAERRLEENNAASRL